MYACSGSVYANWERGKLFLIKFDKGACAGKMVTRKKAKIS